MEPLQNETKSHEYTQGDLYENYWNYKGTL